MLQPLQSPSAARSASNGEGRVKAVLGPTNTGKTHLAIERLCAHSSGMIGFPLRLLAREVYDRVVALKGREHVALITGEERIEPKNARWLLCTAEAMPGADVAFVALDEAQLAADRERGHIFTDRLLHARGREETMILGSGPMEPMVRALVPEAAITGRPRFSTLSHAGAVKLSRLPPRSAIVAFSAEQVYAVAEMLRRFRGGAAVVMGALSPETRNRQVALYQAGEVDYLVATDAIGMGLNLDVTHVAFAGLSKFDGVRQRRLTPAEMAQIAGRAGRHQRDGTFGVLSGGGGQKARGRDIGFTEEEIFAIEEHRFAPVTHLFWREAEPRFDSLAMLVEDLESLPDHPALAPAPQAIDLAVLKNLAEDEAIRATLTTPGQLRRFWQACSLPDFRHYGVETHARFVARLWQELAHGALASDHAPRAIAQLDNVQGDIDTLQMRIAAIRSWTYIAQRPDWVPAREEMAARARAVESRLSDALHARLTERFVHRRTAVLMRGPGADASLLPVDLAGDDVLVEGEAIGTLKGFRFRVDAGARHADHRMMLAAAEKHVPALLAARARELAAMVRNAGAAAPEHRAKKWEPVFRKKRCDNKDLEHDDDSRKRHHALADLALVQGAICWRGEALAQLARGSRLLAPRLAAKPLLDPLPPPVRTELLAALNLWLERRLRLLAPLARVEEASTMADAGPSLRALLIRLVETGGMLERAGSGLDRLDRTQRETLRRLGVKAGALDLFLPAMLNPRALELWHALAEAGIIGPAGRKPAAALRSVQRSPIQKPMSPVIPSDSHGAPLGYRRLGRQAIRLDSAQDLLREAHARRARAHGRWFTLDPAAALARGLTTASYARLLRLAGFRVIPARMPEEGACGPPVPPLWRWMPPRRESADTPGPKASPDSPFAALVSLVA